MLCGLHFPDRGIIAAAPASDDHSYHPGDNGDMQFQRSSGVLLHVSSLPSYGGIGDLGPAAHEFLAFLAAAKQHLWQVLPLCPTGYGNSPYAGSSAFAGNPFLISLELLAEWGWIAAERIVAIAGQAGSSGFVNFDEIESRKLPLLDEAAGNFLDRAPRATSAEPHWPRSGLSMKNFCRAEANWLTDYALYAELRRQFNTGAWADWPEPLRRREPEALAHAAATHARRVAEEQVLQFAFSLQWNSLREAAAENGIRILGDMAIFVNMDSADVWVHPEIFELDEDLQPIRIAGVPPDYFFVHRPALGQPTLSLGCARRQRLRLVDRPHPPRLPSSTTSFASTTSAASRPTGPFPPTRKRPSTASGSRRPASSFSARLKRRSARFRLWPKTSGSSLPRSTRCARSWACRG